MAEVKNLMQGLLDEMNRVKEMITDYKSLSKGAGCFGAAFMELDIKKAEKAISEGDTIQMMVSYTTLKEYEN